MKQRPSGVGMGIRGTGRSRRSPEVLFEGGETEGSGPITPVHDSSENLEVRRTAFHLPSETWGEMKREDTTTRDPFLPT